jgi:hypothetical protein
MPFIKFTQDRTTVEAEPQVFKAGQVYELPEASCERWVRRGAAEHCNERVAVSTLLGPEPLVAQAPSEATARRGKKSSALAGPNG